MRVLVYNDLDSDKIPGLAKVRTALEAGRFDQADVRKIGDNLYRARLNRSDRLLFSLYRYNGETCCLLLEHIPNHAYDRSRFLAGGATIDENRIPAVESPEGLDGEPLTYLHPQHERFHLLDKILSFDDDQESVYRTPPPLVIVGSAGSGKTALTLEKMKQAIGDVLYVSLSPYLVQNARNLYFAHGYDNDAQEVDFLAFHDFLESIRVPEGREVTARDFRAWFQRQRGATRLRDGHKLYEEFRGVITGPVGDQPWLSREQYLELGVKQSIFTEEERPGVYALFERYLEFLKTEKLYDANIVSHRYLELAEPRYDFIVVDEVQDITNIQLYLILKTLRVAGQFMLCGDSNQIVHPNFFAWSSVKSLFFKERDLTGHGEVVRILHSNYRNSTVVTEAANRILKLKHARFGSVDRESNYLVRSVGDDSGRLQLLEDRDAVKRDLNTRTARSTRFAVLVMHADQKARAREWFDTPLVFSVQEAKGLEYDNIILYNFISEEHKAFREIAAGVDPSALEGDELSYARTRDKRDKSLEVYKFYINALYVAVTRAVRTLYLIEADQAHPAMRLLQLDRFTGDLNVERQDSSTEDWQKEARKLELQGKEEQARDIRERVLHQQPVPWSVLDRDGFLALRERALAEGSKKTRLEVFEYALLHHHRPTLNALAEAGFKPARQREDKAVDLLHQNHFQSYAFRNPTAALRDIERYGVDHRTRYQLTPLMIAARLGNELLVGTLVERGADPEAITDHGFTALHFALEQALIDPKFARTRLGRIYPLLAPDSIVIQVEGRLIKLDRRLMEYFLLTLFSALHYRQLGPALARPHGGEAFSAQSLVDRVAELPANVLPERRKRRPYISSVLAKNEIDRDDPYNRKLFVRLKRGHYIVNPDLKIRIGERWWPYYELFRLDDLDIDPADNERPAGPGRSNRNMDPWMRWGMSPEFQRQQLDNWRRHIRSLVGSARL